MEPGAVRKLLCAAKQPFGQITQIMLNDYFEYHRKNDALWQAPFNRCITRVGRGRCRKHVSQAALCQFCWKHGNSWESPVDDHYTKDEFRILHAWLVKQRAKEQARVSAKGPSLHMLGGGS